MHGHYSIYIFESKNSYVEYNESKKAHVILLREKHLKEREWFVDGGEDVQVYFTENDTNFQVCAQ